MRSGFHPTMMHENTAPLDSSPWSGLARQSPMKNDSNVSCPPWVDK
jgi:hypothetical protein